MASIKDNISLIFFKKLQSKNIITVIIFLLTSIFILNSCSTKDQIKGSWGFEMTHEYPIKIENSVVLTFTDEGSYSFSSDGIFGENKLSMMDIGSYKITKNKIKFTEENSQFFINDMPQQINEILENPTLEGEYNFEIRKDYLILYRESGKELKFRKVKNGIVQKLFDENESDSF